MTFYFAILCHVSCGRDVNRNQFIEDFLTFQARSAPASLVTAFLCWRTDALLALSNHMAKSGIMFNTHAVSDAHVLSRYKQHLYQYFILDLDCQHPQLILTQAHQLNMLRKQNRWLLLHENGFNNTFGELDIVLDSDVTLCSAQYELHEVYRRGEMIVINKIGDWEPTRGVRITADTVLAKRRMNMHMSIIRAAAA
ncbi:hypothetical protein L9F63_012750, partial [Diploptera punctata]